MNRIEKWRWNCFSLLFDHFHCDPIQVSLRDHFAKDAIQRQTHSVPSLFFVIFKNIFPPKNYCVTLLVWFLTSPLQLLETRFKRMSATFWADAVVRSLSFLAWTFVARHFYNLGVHGFSFGVDSKFLMNLTRQCLTTLGKYPLFLLVVVTCCYIMSIIH